MPHRPVILGVVGDSAAGKTTITTGIASILGADNVTAICVDDYHRYNRLERKALDITPLHPECNYIDIMEQHLRCLADGEPILKPVYNHTSGNFDAPVYIKPKQFLIVEGLLAFATPRLRDCFHVKVFLDPPEELRRRWKVKRDVAKRGYQPHEVERELRRREGDSAEFIRPQRDWGDMVVRFYPPADVVDSEHLNAQLTLRPTLPHPDLSTVVRPSADGRSVLQLRVDREAGRLCELLEIDGALRPDQATVIEDAIWSLVPELRHLRPEQIGTFVDGQDQRQSHALGLTQLLITYHLLVARLEKMQRAAEAMVNDER